MIGSNEIRTNWIMFTVIVFLTVAGGKCDRLTTDNCKLVTLEQLGEYNIITAEITDISCPLSKTSNFEVETTGSWVNRSFNEIIRNFNATCRRYIDTLAFKYQLQEILFTSNRTLSSDTLLQITSLIINLQTAAMKLQDIELILNKQLCVTFTSKQYKSIYFSRPHQGVLINTLCERARVWQNKTNVCANWTEYMWTSVAFYI